LIAGSKLYFELEPMPAHQRTVASRGDLLGTGVEESLDIANIRKDSLTTTTPAATVITILSTDDPFTDATSEDSGLDIVLLLLVLVSVR